MSITKFDFAFFMNSMVISLALLIHFSQAQNTPQDYLAAHNAARGNVSVGMVTWDNNLATYAMNYAKQRAGDCKLIHSEGPYGENIAWGSTSTFTAVELVKLWIAEKSYYNYGANTCSIGKVCGHYTQIVWRESIRVGCARIVCNNGGTFVVCEYDPPGNWDGEYPY
ncbi:pathogenesis-related protein 1C-like [Papaver somniferum]|nr:pathogenesis-related protein 1C-like [Papaver somniferum]